MLYASLPSRAYLEIGIQLEHVMKKAHLSQWVTSVDSLLMVYCGCAGGPSEAERRLPSARDKVPDLSTRAPLFQSGISSPGFHRTAVESMIFILFIRLNGHHSDSAAEVNMYCPES